MRATAQISLPSRAVGAARRGSVIVVVLVMIMLASLMLVKFMESSSVELTLATREADRERLRADAYSALETFLAVMAEIKAVDSDRLNAPAQGWDDPYGYAEESPREGVQVDFAITDESGKLSLPSLDFEELVELCQVLGLGEVDARRFADGLFGWTKEDHVTQDIDADPAAYERDDPPVTVPKRSLRSWDELRSVRVAREYVYDETGALTPFGTALRENLSLYVYEGANINALAPALGLARGWDETQMQQINAYREGLGPRPPGAPTWFRNIEEVTTVLGANADLEGLTAEAKLLRVDVTVREGAASMVLRALVALDDSVELPQAAEPASGEATPPADAAQTEERLDYPFRILELIETSGPPPAVLTDEEALSDAPSL
ncbi:MAG: type II secretion system protein GspK [Opitutaceae bacterium]|jgi:general secretion pathway protein K|nr:type II secretion system protein GspK [Opitutaceae bacterium]